MAVDKKELQRQVPNTIEHVKELSSLMNSIDNKKFTEKLQKLELDKDQEKKLSDYFQTLSKEDKDKLIYIIENNSKSLKSLLKVFSDKNLNEVHQNLETRVKDLEEKYQDDDIVLEKIQKLKEDINADLLVFYGNNTGYSNTISSVLKSEKPEEFISQKIKTLEFKKEEIGNLDTELKTIESKQEKEKRYAGLDKEYEEVSKVNEFKDIIGEKKFDNLTAGDFHAMLKTSPDKVRSLLLSTSDGESVGDISKNWDNFKNKVLKVNFGTNAGLDKIIGAGDILDIYNVKSVKINGVEGTRKFTPRPGYYTPSGHYLAIHDGYTIEITDTTKLEGKEIEEYKKAQNKRFEEIRGTEIKTSLGEVISSEIVKNPSAKEIQIPYKAKVDTDYINSLVNNTENKYLGLDIKDGKIKVTGENLNIWHLGEVLNSYSDTKAKITDYLSKNKELAKNKVKKIDFDAIGLDNNAKNKEFLENALKKIVGDDKVEITVNSFNFKIDASNTKKKIGDLFLTDYKYNKNGHVARKLNLRTRTEIVNKAPTYIKNLVKNYFPVDEYENALLVCHGESGFDKNAINKNRNGTIDRGLFQINNIHHKKYIGKNIFDPETNVKVALKIFNEANHTWRPWYAARKIGLA